MNDGIHVDYTTIMDGTKVEFPALYELAITKLFVDGVGEHPELQAKLKAKRDFGLKKYGEYSFQGTFERAIASPVFAHLKEEILDSINYLLHIKFQLLFSSIELDFPDKTLGCLVDIYNELSTITSGVVNDNHVPS